MIMAVCAIVSHHSATQMAPGAVLQAEKGSRGRLRRSAGALPAFACGCSQAPFPSLPLSLPLGRFFLAATAQGAVGLLLFRIRGRCSYSGFTVAFHVCSC